MNAEPKNEYGRFRKEGEILLNLISEELKKLLADMRLKPGSDEEEVRTGIEKEITDFNERA